MDQKTALLQLFHVAMMKCVLFKDRFNNKGVHGNRIIVLVEDVDSHTVQKKYLK